MFPQNHWECNRLQQSHIGRSKHVTRDRTVKTLTKLHVENKIKKKKHPHRRTQTST